MTGALSPPDTPSRPASDEAPGLEADYYLRDFLLILDTVLERDEHLFFSEELELFYLLKTLPEDELRLVVRLFNRRGPYFRLERIKYKEISDVAQAAASLAGRGLVWLYQPGESGTSLVRKTGVREPLEMPVALHAYTVPELAQVARERDIRFTAGRGALLCALEEMPPTALATSLLAMGPLLRLSVRPLLSRVQRLFFLNGHQDASTLVTTGLALVRFPSYRVWRTGPVFSDRFEFEQYLEAEVLRDQFYLAVQARDLETAETLGAIAYASYLDSSLGSNGFLERFRAWSVHARTAQRYVELVETRVERKQAVKLYEGLLQGGLPGRYRGRAWVRYALHRERAEGVAAGLEACEAGLAEPSTRDGDRLALKKRRSRLLGAGRRRSSATKSATAKRGTEQPGPAREVVVRRPLVASGLHQRAQFEDAEGAPMPVEQLALAAYRSVGLNGLYTENVYFTTLLWVFFWDILFTPVPDVFQTPFQDAPLDLNTEEFYLRRKGLIEERLDNVRAGDFSLLYRHHEAYFGTFARGVSWESFSLEELAAGAKRLGGERLASILGHLVRDFRARRRGLPDLLVWREDATLATLSSDAGRAYWDDQGYTSRADIWFAEVKSPRDRLSVDQRAWLDVLARSGIFTEICRVEDGGIAGAGEL